MKSLFIAFAFAALFIGKNSVAAEEFYVNSGDVSLWVSTQGKSDNVLILISGGPGSSSDYLKSLQKLSNTHLKVVRFDMRGTGKSSAPASDADYGPQNYMQDVASIQAALGVKKAHIMGISFGGLTAMNYTAAYPDRVKSLVLYGSAPTNISVFNATDGYSMRQQALIAIGALEENPSEGSYEASRKYWSPLFFDPYFQIPNEILQTSNSDQVSELTMAAFGDFDFRSAVATITLPVLVLSGENDPFELGIGATIRSLRMDLAKAKLKVRQIPRCGHLWQECPGKALAKIRSFLLLH